MPTSDGPLPVNLVLAAWVLAAAVAFWRFGGRPATLVVAIGGWAVLPNAEYPAEVIRAGGETVAPVHALAMSAGPWLNKATAVGLGCLIGVVLFGRSAVRRVRPARADAALLAWVGVPVASAVANGLPATDGLLRAAYLLVAWGGPYLAGRVWFADPVGLQTFAHAWVLAGVAYLPLGLAEFVAGPFWYRLVYGGHPYRFDGADRWIGHRPLVFLEHGNQLGVWSAAAAVAAIGLWAAGHLRWWGGRRWGLPGWVVVATLTGACVLWQSHGAVAILAAAAATLYALCRARPVRWPVPTAAVAVVVLAAGAWVVAAGGPAGARQQVRGVFHGIGKSSFTWRLARVEEHAARIAQRPVLGWGQPDWSQRTADGTFTDPVALSLWLLTAGMFGLVGVTAAAGLLIPPVRAGVTGDRGDRLLAGVLIGVSVADSAFNSVLLLPVLVAAGGLAGRTRSTAVGLSVAGEPRPRCGPDARRAPLGPSGVRAV